MGRLYDAIDESLAGWIARQHLFFVATAPNDPAAHLNLSPKGGIDAFRVLGPTTVAYVDLVGSGIETTAHLRENGRIVVMFCAFAGPPRIVRLHGQGRVVPEGDAAFAGLLAGFPLDDATRATARGIVVVEVGRVSDSCGFGVPRMQHVADRDQLQRWAERQRAQRGEAWKSAYMAANNTASIDGLPGLDLPEPPTEGEAGALSSAGWAL